MNADPGAGIKEAARSQWSHDPAGAFAAGDEPLGTPRSFELVEQQRHKEQPWMRDTFRFERFAGRQVLEIGVGLGTDHLHLVRAGADVTGIDLTPRCVDLTKKRLELEGWMPKISVMDAEALQFPDNSFDAVYSFGVLHHTADPVRAFREVRRVLRPGGEFVGALYNKHSFSYGVIRARRLLFLEFRHESLEDRHSRIEFSTSGARPHVRLFTRRTLTAALHEAEFDHVAIKLRHAGLGRHTTKVPPAVDRVIGRLFGWYLIHTAA